MKILVVAQHILPMQTPRSHRTTELVKELGRQGHEVIVYAVLGKYDYSKFERDHNVTVKNIPIRWQLSPYHSDDSRKRTLIDRLLARLLGRLFEFPYIEFRKRIPQIIRIEPKADLLISIADPHHIHWGCALAKKQDPQIFPTLWIADCGDPFMDNGNATVHRKYFAKYERQFCSLCDYITVPVVKAENGYYPEFKSKIRVLPQGFSFDLADQPTAEPRNPVVTFMYAGIFYSDIRNPKNFFDFLVSLDIDFKFIVYTRYDDLIYSYKRLLKHKLEIRNPIPRDVLIEEMKKMDFLVNIENINSPNQLPSKLIDYTIAARPILSINPESVNKEWILQFLERNYENKYIVEDLNSYHITNVVEKLMKLTT